MHRLIVLRPVAHERPERGAKVIALRSRRSARIEQRIARRKRKPRRDAA